MLIIYCICLFDGCFGSGVWQCWNCRVPFFFVGIERDARGRWHRSGEWMQAGVFLRFCGVDGEGRQRKVASVRGWMGGCSRGCF